MRVLVVETREFVIPADRKRQLITALTIDEGRHRQPGVEADVAAAHGQDRLACLRARLDVSNDQQCRLERRLRQRRLTMLKVGKSRSPSTSDQPRLPISPKATVPTCGGRPFVYGSNTVSASVSKAARRALLISIFCVEPAGLACI
jgi:hypothetical protein